MYGGRRGWIIRPGRKPKRNRRMGRVRDILKAQGKQGVAGVREPKDVGSVGLELRSGVRYEAGWWTLDSPSSLPSCS